MKRSLAAFTLIEFMVATAIASFIALAAVASATTIIRDLNRNELLVQSYDRAKTLMDYLITRTQQSGGGALRPWAAMQVIDDVATNGGAAAPVDAKPGTDMIFAIVTDDTLAECPIVDRSGGNLETSAAPTCCFSPAASYENRPLTVVTKDGDFFGTMLSGNVHSVSPPTCKLNFPPSGPAGQIYGAGTAKLPGSDAAFVGGSIIVTQQERLYVNTSNQLILQQDLNNDQVFEDIVVSENVYDLQVALGYDVDGNGVVAEDATINDEWLHNATGDVLGANGLINAQFNNLRMTMIGVSVGTPFPGGGAPTQLLNGPAMSSPGTLLRATTSRAFMRNLNIFF